MRFKLDENLPRTVAEVLFATEPVAGSLWIDDDERVRIRGA